MGIVRRLYMSNNREGKLAEEELKKHSVKYIPIKNDDETIEPILVTPEGYFEGLEKIREYARYWASLSRYGIRAKRSIYVY